MKETDLLTRFSKWRNVSITGDQLLHTVATVTDSPAALSLDRFRFRRSTAVALAERQLARRWA